MCVMENLVLSPYPQCDVVNYFWKTGLGGLYLIQISEWINIQQNCPSLVFVRTRMKCIISSI